MECVAIKDGVYSIGEKICQGWKNVCSAFTRAKEYLENVDWKGLWNRAGELFDKGLELGGNALSWIGQRASTNWAEFSKDPGRYMLNLSVNVLDGLIYAGEKINQFGKFAFRMCKSGIEAFINDPLGTLQNIGSEKFMALKGAWSVINRAKFLVSIN